MISATQAITGALQMIVEPSRLPGAYIASVRFGRISSSEVPILQGQVWIVVFAGADFFPAPCPPPVPPGTRKPCPTPVPVRPEYVAVDARTGKVLVAWG